MNSRTPSASSGLRVYDCIVVGGGPAGCAAAYSAAKGGCSTLLIERHGFLGGMGTAASLSCFINYRYGDHDLSGAFYRLVISELAQMKATYQVERGNADIFEPEAAKLVLENLLIARGVEIVHHSSIEAAVHQGGNWELEIFHKSGSYRVKAPYVVDATGDADLAYRGGAQLTFGRSSDGQAQPLTMVTQLAGVNPAAFQQSGKSLVDGRYVYGSTALAREIIQARALGEWSIPRQDIAMFWSMPWDPTRVTINGTRILGLSACKVDDLSTGERDGRRQSWELSRFFQKYVPGFEHSYLFQTGPQIGIRESRRIVGRGTLTTEDVLNSRRPADSVVFCAYPIDVHQPDGDGTDFDNHSTERCYGIPYSCLQPTGLENLLAAGRCISASHEAAGSFRVMSTCMNLGEAAGTAVAIGKQEQLKLHEVPAAQVIAQLSEPRRSISDPSVLVS